MNWIKGFKLDKGKPNLVLGIETTCDETAAAVVERQSDGSGRILSNIVRSQTEEHARFGGVVPEIAARAHVDLLDGIIAQAMNEAGIEFAELSAVAAAAGPGLIGGVIVGLTTAKAIAMVHDTPLIAVNHLEAHALTPRPTCALAFPYCLFLASGGHTQIVAVAGVGNYVRLGTTVDDAMGEAFDKVAKMWAGHPATRRSSARRSAEPGALRVSAADVGRDRCRFLALGIEDRRAQRSRPADDAGAEGHQRSLRELSGRGAGIDADRPSVGEIVQENSARARAGRGRVVSPPTRRNPRRAVGCRGQSTDDVDHPAASAVRPTMVRSIARAGAERLALGLSGREWTPCPAPRPPTPCHGPKGFAKRVRDSDGVEDCPMEKDHAVSPSLASPRRSPGVAGFYA